MDWFLANTFYVWLAAMIGLGYYSLFVHGACIYMLNAFSATQPDDMLRESEKNMHFSMAGVNLGMMFFMVVLSGWMWTICSTAPFLGALAHLPLISFMAFMGYVASHHFRRQLKKIKALP